MVDEEVSRKPNIGVAEKHHWRISIELQKSRAGIAREENLQNRQ